MMKSVNEGTSVPWLLEWFEPSMTPLRPRSQRTRRELSVWSHKPEHYYF